ncbi:MAG: carbohydrate ABC transporter permease [Propionicimonas sp.]|uniref:carbohydrate ABC transporter permease n=1 Tax=Propionicimonas sp. TaxID=1955623 RepID=UPI002B1EC42D|nr:carbohydrate ABC transporter permease [Propionicimonas sp.]MEA4943822.1 carbohydrate ABC transporter permease [Propionicimonas sp.]MEA5119251.1 carbohydrate ABC transporter permease [Propionicimonas sp.]
MTVADRPMLARLPKRRIRLGAILATTFIGAYVLVINLPVFTVLSGSLKTSNQITTDPLGLPNPVDFTNYIRGWNGVAVGEPMWVYLLNTAVFTVVAVAVVIVLGTMAAYAISRSSNWVSTLAERYYLVLYTLPFLATIVPLYSITGDLGLRDNPAGVGLVYAASWMPMTVVLMLAFFASFPLDVIEAAKTDGASEWRAFVTIVVPMSQSAVLSNLLLAFIYAWNNLSHTFPLLTSPTSLTVAPGILLFSSQYTVDQGAQLAGMFMTVIPLILAYAVLHRHIMESFRVGSFR